MAESILDYRDVTKDHWDTMQQWRIDEGKTHARARSNQISRMAAGGVQTGSEQWETNLAAIDAVSAKEQASFADSATQGILDRWTKEMKSFYVNAAVEPWETIFTGGEREKTITHTTSEYRQMQKKGGPNVYTDSGLSEEEFKALDTEEFMKLSFGTLEGSENNRERVSGAVVNQMDAAGNTLRQQAASSQTQQASPWWA